MSDHKKRTASVIIATYNRGELLDECLTYLRQQTFVDGDEIIVVDNGSSDSTPDVLARHASDWPVPFVRLVEACPGKSPALATALTVARGDILAFTDDDVLVPPDWLTEIRRALASGDADLIGGPVMPRWEQPAPAWLRLHNGSGYGRMAAPLALLDYGPTPGVLGPRTLLGANLAVKREVLQQLGGFDQRLGKLRGTLRSGEDHDLCFRAQAAGFTALYSPTVQVEHWVPGHRMRVGYFVSWFYWSGVTNATIERHRSPDRSSIPAFGLRLARRFLGNVVGATVAVITGQAPSALERVLDTAFTAGYAARHCGLVGTSSPPPVQSERTA